MIRISRNTFIRIISFAVAIVAVLCALLYQNYRTATQAKQALQYSYLRAVNDLALSLDNIKNTLNKGIYSNSPDMMGELSSKLWNDAANAKVSISQLPFEDANLENTYKFLSQVGNYAKHLAQKVAAGEQISEEENQNIATLFDYAQNISSSMWDVESQIHGGYLTFEKAAKTALSSTSDANEGSPNHITNGFSDIEAGFDNYPTLIYDGPFSDHIMQKDPLMLEGQQEVSEGKALEKAKLVSGNDRLRLISEEMGRMPSYVFAGGNTTVSVTKDGGFFSYMLTYRQIGNTKLTVEKAIDIASKYLANLGMEEVVNTYYETQNGMCIINFASQKGKVTMYTDLVKVGVALDNGEILSYDARGYITNHYERELKTPLLSLADARTYVSPNLKISATKLCIIPSEGMNERYCYEFNCTSADGQQLLVYINADTGKEEQILILQINEHGMLTV